MLTQGSLFSGIGGFEQGAKLSGIETIWNCEYEKYQRGVLLKRYPNAKQYDDIRTMQNPKYVDIISGIVQELWLTGTRISPGMKAEIEVAEEMGILVVDQINKI